MNERQPTGKPTDKELADRIMRRYERANGERAVWLPLWEELAQYVRPNRDPIMRQSAAALVPRLDPFVNLFDSTAINANMILASGTMARLTPAQSPWFKFEAPKSFGASDRAKLWYDECTILAHEALATSNFYTELHEAYLDRGAFGTSCIHCDGGQKHPLVFRVSDLGGFALQNSADGIADTVFRDLRFDVRQAAQMFGEDALPDAMRDILKAGPSDTTRKFDFIHAIYPREDHERDGGKMDAVNMPVASVYIEKQSRKIVRQSGFSEMPAFGSRYLRWGDSPYGFCPAWMALPDCRQLNDLQKNLDVLAEVSAFPRMLVPEDLEGQLDLRASGITYFRDPTKAPKEWMTQGRYDIGMDRVKYRTEMIERAFHVQLFQQWQEITKQMTAAEVNARELEKIELFSPTFTLLTVELYGPLLRRVFSLLLRQNCFPPPPPEAVYMTGMGRYAVPDPAIRYTSRLALALQAVRTGALNNAIARAGQMSAFAPQVVDNLNWDQAFRDSAMDDGVPVEWIQGEEDVQNARQARAQQQQQQAQMDQAHQVADSASKLASSGLIPTQQNQQQ